MILAIDIGNTAITLGRIQGGRVIARAQVPAAPTQAILREQLGAAVRKLCRKKCPEDVLICSVVPSVLKVTEKVIAGHCGLKPTVIGRDIKVPVTNCYRYPRQVGQDRLVGAYAALKLYGAPVIVVDLGTAITVDVVSRKKEYLGGIIMPGIRLSADMLFQKTALLPKVRIQAPRSVIGRDTQNSILSGIFYGYGEMLTGLIERVSKEVKGRPKVVITGGYAHLMKKFLAGHVDVIDRDLVLKGIMLIRRIEDRR